MKSITCTELGRELGKHRLQIGRIRAEVCDEDDMDGKAIKPSGVAKICAFLEQEMVKVETASPDTVRVQVLPHKTSNPRFVYAKDLERKVKVLVSIPKNRKHILQKPRTILTVNRGSENGEFFYRYPTKGE